MIKKIVFMSICLLANSMHPSQVKKYEFGDERAYQLTQMANIKINKIGDGFEAIYLAAPQPVLAPKNPSLKTRAVNFLEKQKKKVENFINDASSNDTSPFKEKVTINRSFSFLCWQEYQGRLEQYDSNGKIIKSSELSDVCSEKIHQDVSKLFYIRLDNAKKRHKNIQQNKL